MAPQLIIRSVMSKIQGGNLTDYITNISTSGPHGRQCSEYYASLNKVIDMIDSVNSNTVSLQSSDFEFLMNPNGTNKDRYIRIISDMLEFPAKGIFSANQVRAAGHFYDDKPHKLGGKQRLVTTDSR